MNTKTMEHTHTWGSSSSITGKPSGLARAARSSANTASNNMDTHDTKGHMHKVPTNSSRPRSATSRSSSKFNNHHVHRAAGRPQRQWQSVSVIIDQMCPARAWPPGPHHGRSATTDLASAPQECNNTQKMNACPSGCTGMRWNAAHN